MNITMTIPDREWYALAGKAEKAGVKIADLVTAAVASLVQNNPHRVVLADRVQHLVEQGIPDPVISHRLQISLEQTRAIRRDLDLKPVKFRREQWEQELAGPGRPGPSHFERTAA